MQKKKQQYKKLVYSAIGFCFWYTIVQPIYLHPICIGKVSGEGYNFLENSSYKYGDVAQLARALAWHAKGQGFESPYLH